MINKLCGILLLLLIYTQTLGQGIKSELIKGLPSNLEPGTKNTVVFRIVNESQDSVYLDIELTAPQGWRLFYNKSVLVPKNSTSILPIGIVVPKNAKPGLHQLGLELVNQRTGNNMVINFDTHILKFIDIDVQVVNAPNIAMAGKEILVDYSLYNKK